MHYPPTWVPVLTLLREEYGRQKRCPLPLGNHADPYDEAIYIGLTYMTRSQAAIEHAFASLQRLAVGSWSNLLCASTPQVQECLQPLGLVTRRTASLLALVRRVEEEHDGCLMSLAGLPDDELLDVLGKLPGLGPKGARCVALYSFGRDVLPVDVHVLRVAKRLGFLDREATWKDAHPILEAQVSPEHRFDAHVLLVIHGRSLCRNRKPDCLSCPLVDVCPEAFMASDDRGTYVVELRR